MAIEWRRTDLGEESVLMYRNFQFDPAKQDPSYTDRVDLLVGQIKKGDASLSLKDTTTDDSGTYECRVVKEIRGEKLISTISLVVAPPRPPEPFPVWATVLLVLLVLVLIAAQVLIFWLWHRFSVQQVEVESGVEFVRLPWRWTDQLVSCRSTSRLPGDVRVVWRDDRDRKVHVHQNGSDCSDEQNQRYRTRTKMDKNLSLTLKRPTCEDNGFYTCKVSRGGKVLMKKDVVLKVKVQEQVEVESGVASVKLPWTIKEDLDEDVRVEWRVGSYRKVHVYQNGSDQPGDQDPSYRTRTKMDENLLETKNLSLTLIRPTVLDMNVYTCIVSNRKGDVLMKKQVWLWVKAGTVQDQPDDNMMPLLQNQLV